MPAPILLLTLLLVSWPAAAETRPSTLAVGAALHLLEDARLAPVPPVRRTVALARRLELGWTPGIFGGIGAVGGFGIVLAAGRVLATAIVLGGATGLVVGVLCVAAAYLGTGVALDSYVRLLGMLRRFPPEAARKVVGRSVTSGVRAVAGLANPCGDSLSGVVRARGTNPV